MITGIHAMLYSSRPADLRAFIRDRLGFTTPTDVGGGWLIFPTRKGELGVHPARPAKGGAAGTHNVSFYCDDLVKTVSELKAKGVKFIGKIVDRGYALSIRFKMPGGVIAELFQPHYKLKAGTRKR